MSSTSTRDVPSRDISSRQSVPKFDIEKIAISREGQSVRQRALEITRGFVRRMLEVGRAPLGDHVLRSVRRDADDASARIRRPQRAVGFREDALGPLQIVSDILERVPVDSEVEDRVAGQTVGSMDRPYGVVKSDDLSKRT